jgi:hypothetical protein
MFIKIKMFCILDVYLDKLHLFLNKRKIVPINSEYLKYIKSKENNNIKNIK